MKEREFDDLIQAERNRSLPECPLNLEDKVLRRIRQEAVEPETAGSLEWLFGLTWKGALVSMLILTISLSTGASILVSSNYLSSLESRELASHALDFDILKDIHSLEFDR